MITPRYWRHQVCCRCRLRLWCWLQGRMCSNLDITEGLSSSGLPRLLDTVEGLCETADPAKSTDNELLLANNNPAAASIAANTTVSTILLLALLALVIGLLVAYPLPD